MKNMKTTAIFELFESLNIDLEEIIKEREMDIKEKKYQKNIRFSKMFNGQNKFSRVEEFKAMKEYFPTAIEETKFKMLRNVSKDYFTLVLPENIVIKKETVLETKNGYDLQIVTHEKLNLNEAVNRRFRYINMDAVLKSFEYRKEDNTFSFSIYGRSYRYVMNLTTIDLGSLILGVIPDNFFSYIVNNSSSIERIYETVICCEPKAHRWTILDVGEIEPFLKLSPSYWIKEKKYIVLDDRHIVIFEYSDYIRSICRDYKEVRNFKDVLNINGINEIEDRLEHSTAMISSKNKTKKFEDLD